MLKSICETSGLGNAPDAFYTNDVESANRIIKILKEKTTKCASGQNFVNLLKHWWKSKKMKLKRR